MQFQAQLESWETSSFFLKTQTRTRLVYHRPAHCELKGQHGVGFVTDNMGFYWEYYI